MVIAIIGILIALLLPAVQAAREAARRMECTNKLKQIALALHNYHDVNGAFPQGGITAWPNKVAWSSSTNSSFLVMILPYIEQTAIYDNACASSFKHLNVRTPPMINSSKAPNSTDKVYHKPIPSYWCPSDSEAVWVDAGLYSRSSYAACHGDNSVGNLEIPFWWYDKTGAMTRGMFSCQENVDRWVTMATCLDGTSNTVWLSERTVSIVMGSNMKYDGTGHIKRVMAIGTNGRNACMGRKGAHSMILGESKGIDKEEWVASGAGKTNYNHILGHNFACGALVGTGFQTMLPPNAPSCESGGGSYMSNTIVSAQSFHSGGCNAAMTDASVRFVSDTIDVGNLSESSGTTGPSKCGVWGAMGTCAGGESVSL